MEVEIKVPMDEVTRERLHLLAKEKERSRRQLAKIIFREAVAVAAEKAGIDEGRSGAA